MEEQRQCTAPLDMPRHWDDLRELERAIGCHAEWLKDTHRRMVCNQPPNANDLQENAHHLCEFGKWYYGKGHPFSQEHEDFRHLGETHKAMHGLLRLLLKTLHAGEQPQTEDYDLFINKSQQFNTEMRALQFSLLSERYQTDPLTGAMSRHGMMARLEQEFSRLTRHHSCCTIAMLDFDYFKQINDTHGHQAGDEVLRVSVGRIREILRSYDLIFRYGGEEFLICFPDTAMQLATEISQRIHAVIQEQPVRLKNDVAITVTASIGLAELDYRSSLEVCIANADQALMSAKAMGRNRLLAWPA